MHWPTVVVLGFVALALLGGRWKWMLYDRVISYRQLIKRTALAVARMDNRQRKESWYTMHFLPEGHFGITLYDCLSFETGLNSPAEQFRLAIVELTEQYEDYIQILRPSEIERQRPRSGACPPWILR